MGKAKNLLSGKGHAIGRVRLSVSTFLLNHCPSTLRVCVRFIITAGVSECADSNSE